MPSLLLYTVTVVGLLGLYLVVRPGGRPVRIAGMLLGLATFAWLLKLGVASIPGDSFNPFALIFSLIAVAAGGRMISHPRPVFAALYFVLVVISSAGLLLMLEAEFMAFAVIIVYAGAILITYLFVLMLAHQSPTPEEGESPEAYDRLPREPGAAILVGFFVMALLAHTLVGPKRAIAIAPSPVERAQAVWLQLESMPVQFRDTLEATHPGFDWPPTPDDATGRLIQIDANGDAFVMGHLVDETRVQRFDLPDSAAPRNVQQVGWALVAKFPASLEVAGVILLMAMFGAVVLARRQIELGEDELRESAGLQRLTDGEATAGGAS